MAKHPVNDMLFEQLLSNINRETNSPEAKLEILYGTRGFYSALQVSRLLYAFPAATDRLRAVQILEPRMCRMTCSEARDILGTFSIHNDKLNALQCVKRYLTDNATREGQEQILICFVFEKEKRDAQCILNTVRSDVADKLPSGGHQGYAACGGLYTQCPPNDLHLYGSVVHQFRNKAGYGDIQLPAGTNYDLLPSMYTGHPSYAYPPGREYSTENAFPNNVTYDNTFGKPYLSPRYPTGAPPLGVHQGGASPVGFQE